MCNKLVLALAAAFFAGFGIVLKGADAPATKPPADLVARIHFVGMTQVAANPKAASFNALWQLPATQELLNETLAKLATAPYRILQSHFADHNDHADLIRPCSATSSITNLMLKCGGQPTPCPNCSWP